MFPVLEVQFCLFPLLLGGIHKERGQVKEECYTLVIEAGNRHDLTHRGVAGHHTTQPKTFSAADWPAFSVTISNF